MGRSRGRGHEGSGWLRQNPQEERQNVSHGNRGRGRRTIQTVVQEATQAYQEGTNEDIRRIIQNLESGVLKEQSSSETEEWAELIKDPGNTRGRMTLYRESLHIYWMLKCLLAKAMEQVATEMTEIANRVPNLQKEMKNFQTIMIKQNDKLEEMTQVLSQLIGIDSTQEGHMDISKDIDQNKETRKK